MSTLNPGPRSAVNEHGCSSLRALLAMGWGLSDLAVEHMPTPVAAAS